MRKLDRDPAPPAGLNQYQHGRDQWQPKVPSAQVRTAIWDKLNAMQGQRCAYCEGPIDQENRHIEHFRQRSRYPQGTFDWHNLFGSCQRQGCCGDHKDKCGNYDTDVLIKPDVENPDDLLLFTQDGMVHPRADLSAVGLHRAQETIRILNLNGSLKAIRREAVRGYVQTAEGFAELAADPQYTEADWLPLLQEELQNTAHLPYATAIRHVLTRQD